MILPLKEYPGRKGGAGTPQKILSQVPKCKRFIEAMAGSGKLSSILEGTCDIVINDLDRSTIDKIGITAGANVEKRNQDYFELIREFDKDPETVFYFDPPYLMETRSSKARLYRHEWNHSDHLLFLERVQKMISPAIISHYPCNLYDDALSEWRSFTFQAMSRGGVKTEKVWMNYPPPVLLQCPHFIGDNFTDRQRIKRKVARMMDKLNREQSDERAAILSSIIAQFSYVRS